MTSTTITDTTLSTDLYDNDAAWATAQGDANADGTQNALHVSAKGPTVFQVRRAALLFDTSVVAPSQKITAASLSLYCVQVLNGAAGWGVQVQNGQPTYPHNPVVVGDYNQANYSGNGGSKVSNTFNIGAYNTIDLNSDGISWINKGGITKLLIRQDANDIANSEPAAERRVDLGDRTVAGQQPKLNITSFSSTALAQLRYRRRRT